MPRMTARRIRAMKAKGQRIPVVTAYDYSFARLADRAGFPIVLVGDSLGMVCLGYDSTIPVTMDDMVRHTRAVVRGADRPLVVTDMPFMSFQTSMEDAVKERRKAGAGRRRAVGEAGRAQAPRWRRCAG